MSTANVVVIDSTLRKVTVKVNQSTYLSQVVEEACQKLRLTGTYGLKNQNKVVDTSRTFRQSGLVSGAKLNLVVVSQSPSAVKIALQLPDGSRLTDNVPSNTTLWQILRKFEEREGKTLNITFRSVAQVSSGVNGAGRMMYEMPVLNILGREVGTFEELQKTLAQFGLNNGSGLLRMSFRQTDQPLEEAMKEISKYFNDDESPENAAEISEDLKPVAEASTNHETKEMESLVSEDTEMSNAEDGAGLTLATEDVGEQINPDSPAKTATEPEQSVLGPDGRPILIYRPPSNTTPRAALVPYNENDYEPTITHAKLHQSRLQNNSHNKRLPSDAEADQQEKERAEKLALVKDIKIKLRFPDQSIIEAIFDTEKTASDLHAYARGLIVAESAKFKLTYFGTKGMVIIENNDKKLIKDLGLKTAVLIQLFWDGNEDRSGPVLKPQYIAKAMDITVPEVPTIDADEDDKTPADDGSKDSETPKKKGLRGILLGGLHKGNHGKK